MTTDRYELELTVDIAEAMARRIRLWLHSGAVDQNQKLESIARWIMSDAQHQLLIKVFSDDSSPINEAFFRRILNGVYSSLVADGIQQLRQCAAQLEEFVAEYRQDAIPQGPPPPKFLTLEQCKKIWRWKKKPGIDTSESIDTLFSVKAVIRRVKRVHEIETIDELVSGHEDSNPPVIWAKWFMSERGISEKTLEDIVLGLQKIGFEPRFE